MSRRGRRTRGCGPTRDATASTRPSIGTPTSIHLHVQAGEVRNEGASAGVTMAAAMVSALAGRPLRGDVAMTG